MIKKKFDKINNEEVKLLSSEIVDEGGAVLSDLFNLSTDETIIGTFGNKPIYRRIVILNGYQESFNTGVTNIDTVFRLDMMVQQTSNGDWRNIPWLYNADYDSTFGTAAWAGGFYFRPSTGVVFMQIGISLQDYTKMVLVIEYTKTTD